MDTRDTFLLKMYEAMWGNINRHITLVWQAIAVLAGAIGALGLVEAKVLSIDMATTFIVLLAGWQIANVFDANSWYNRNLLIIANIERQFLTPPDSREIHWYFTRHRDYELVDHYKIHFYFGLAIAILVLCRHFYVQIYVGGLVPWSIADFIPYVTSLASAYFLFSFHKKRINKYKELRAKSPGRLISESLPNNAD